MYEEIFGERIAQLRLQKNVSAREMSLALGQNSSYINRIENKLALPSMSSFFYICEYFNITPQEFFDTEIAAPNELREVIANLKRLNAKQLKTIAVLIADLAD